MPGYTLEVIYLRRDSAFNCRDTRRMAHIKNWFKKANPFKKASVFIIGIAVVVLIINKTTSSQNAKVSYQTAKVEKGTLVSTVSATGQVSYTNSASVTTQVSGAVNKVYVKNGDQVKAGDPIIQIALDQDSMQKYVQALASYQSAKNSLANAQASTYSLRSAMITAQQNFLKQAVNKGKDSNDPTYKQLKADKDSAETKYNNQDNVISQAETSLNSASLALKQASPTTYAPIAGTISGLSIQPGTVIAQSTSSSNSNVTTSQKLANISTLSAPMITVDLSEIDIPKVHVGQKATLTFDALPDKTFTGSVTGIDTTGTVSSGVTTYETVITLDTIASEIFANMSATANIIVATKTDALYVPTSAVLSQNGQAYVRTLVNGTLTNVNVETGISSDSGIEILSGVTEGEEIVTSVITQTTGTTKTTTTSPFGIRTGGMGGAIRRD